MSLYRRSPEVANTTYIAIYNTVFVLSAVDSLELLQQPQQISAFYMNIFCRSGISRIRIFVTKN